MFDKLNPLVVMSHPQIWRTASGNKGQRMGMPGTLEKELRRLEITKAALAARLDISQQAIGRWIDREEIPASRRQDIEDLFGSDTPLRQYIKKGKGKAITQTLPRAVVPTPARHISHHIDAVLAAEFPRAYLHQDVTIHALRFQVDYLSPNLAVEIKTYSAAQNQLLIADKIRAALWRCAMLKHAEKAKGRARLLIVHYDPDPPIAKQTIWEAAQADVELLYVQSVGAVASAIRDREENAGAWGIGEESADEYLAG